MTEQNKTDACRAEFEKWYFKTWNDTPMMSNLLVQSMYNGFKAAYNLPHNETPTGHVRELIGLIDRYLKHHCNINIVLLDECLTQLQQANGWIIKRDSEGEIIFNKGKSFMLNGNRISSCEDFQKIVERLQQTEKMRSALKVIAEPTKALNADFYINLAKQALNNKG